MKKASVFHEDVTRQTRAIRRRIGEILHVQRVRRGVSLRRLSRDSGLSMNVIDRIEMGKGCDDLRCIVALGKILRVDVGDLFVNDVGPFKIKPVGRCKLENLTPDEMRARIRNS